ncbi:iron complex outermembrane receptor protein [Paucibacter oligotrophus]|uniref:Iron complex outermembrane receptor protein n=1 Tax=Roseateles oligotrophus TaxID=1769250 RepID=A0A840LBD5_9BURK|nr:TonB-dependent receptor [Roseateles oligotrophus]MBB4845904.1 iron complex outermembrane receptor protein [Roseateles oligotrophus]
MPQFAIFKRPRRAARSSRPLPCATLGLLTLLSAGLADAQDEPKSSAATEAADTQSMESLGRVVVTATRGTKAVEKIPGAVSIIAREEVDRQTLISEDPSQLLAVTVPGYSPSRQKLSSFGESLRGRSALLLLDGIPQTNPLRAGGRDGYFADAMIVERVEVISGASAVQGMGATGGIINTITRRPKQVGTRHGVELKFGTQLHGDTASWKAGYTLAHKSEGVDGFDALAYLGTRQQGVGVDGDGRPLAAESLHKAADVFVKLGKDFGDQRVQLMFNRYEADGFDDRADLSGDRKSGRPTSSRPAVLKWDSPRTHVRSVSLDWSHADLAGGQASLQLFKQDFKASFTGSIFSIFQDPAIAPAGTLVDRSELVADKWGLRSSWVRPDLGLKGLELSLGVDVLNDISSQRLTMTERVWMPPLQYRSVAPFTQLEYEWGPLTLRGGLRDERSRLAVSTYRTLAAYGSREVMGGERQAQKLVKSLGGVWRFGKSGWSSFASYNEGFGPTDVGVVLRAVRTPGQSVDKLVDLQAVVTDNRELGLAWRGRTASFSTSVYRSHSDLGTQTIVSNGLGVVQRVPITVNGFEFTGEWQASRDLRLNAIYSQTRGRTAAGPNLPMDLDLGARAQGPDKLVLAGQWQFAPALSAQLTAQHFRPRHANVGKLAGSVRLDEHFSGYTLLDLSTRWLSPWGSLSVGVENLLDRQYLTYYSEANYAGTNDDYYAGRGRNLSMSWRREF